MLRTHKIYAEWIPVKLSYSDHGYNEFTLITNKILLYIWSQMNFYSMILYGCSESIFIGPREFVITEFDCMYQFLFSVSAGCQSGAEEVDTTSGTYEKLQNSCQGCRSFTQTGRFLFQTYFRCIKSFIKLNLSYIYHTTTRFWETKVVTQLVASSNTWW